ncbi:MAG: methyltransferase domain-containing protein [Opitutales bacterium]
MTVDWQERYDQGDIPWEKGAPSPPLRSWLNRHPGTVRGLRLLVPGCGWGHDARLFARAGASVTGLDLAESAVKRARALSGPDDDGCRFLQGDLFAPDTWHDQRPFDGLVEHTCFCAIDPGDRDRFVRSCEQLIRPGGLLIGMFFPDTGNPPGEGPPYPCTVAELEHRFGPGFRLLAAWRPQVGYPGRVGCEYGMIRQRRESFSG